ncbi:MAG: hypothetical protein HZC38_04565 [Chloroflexi bacterium]|nr:hypothetical protein [Chloroflexota bacterium]
MAYSWDRTGEKMNHYRISKYLPIFFMLCGCATPNTPQTNVDIQVRESSNQIKSFTEIIRINNCGGKADSKQTSERSFSVKIGGTIGAMIGYVAAEGSVSANYGQYRNVTKRQELTAPPVTNMEFTLQWTEREWIGNIISGSQSGPYIALAPISVEQIGSRDLGCGVGSQPSAPTYISPTNAVLPTIKPQVPTATSQQLTAPLPADVFNCGFIDELLKKSQVNQVLVGGRGAAGVQARLTQAVDVPIGWTVHNEGVEYKGPVRFQAGTFASFWGPYQCEPLNIPNR